MTHRLGFFLALIAVALGCAPTKPQVRNTTSTDARPPVDASLPTPKGDGLPLLKEVMTKYNQARSYQATSVHELLANNDPKDKAHIERLMLVQNPNRYRVTCSIGNIKAVSLSDGEKAMEFTSANAELYDAPTSMATADSTMIGTYTLAGSLLYRFFAGPEFVDELVNTDKDQVKLLESKNPDEAVVEFYAVDPWGKTRVTIDKKNKSVIKIECDMNAVVAASQQAPERDMRLDSLSCTETFKNIEFDKPISGDAFKVAAPAGAKVQDLTKQDNGQLKPGSPAPNFEVTATDNEKKLELRDLKDSIVMIDFWATWCNPCRRGLPDTTAIWEKYKGKGLKVLAITDEDKELVKQFRIEAKLPNLPSYHDKSGNIGRLYGVEAIPTIVIIDRRGAISEIMVGLNEKHEILKALRRAGLQL